jgi:hypothetical protein
MRRRLTPVIGLLLLAPFVGEFLLGNITVAEIGLALFLAPLYGCGALLVREIGRRRGGWPSMVLLAMAYALIEEGPADQLLWNPSYAGHDYLSGPSYIPALGMSVEVTQSILALHTVWSICVPIAIVEAFVPDREDTPWLERLGLAFVATGYVLGVALVFWGNYAEERFMASPGQFAGTSVVIVALIWLAFVVPKRNPPLARAAPSPWVVGTVALVLTSAWWAPSIFVTTDSYEWFGVGIWLLVAGAGALLVSRWSRQRGWDQRHRFALAAGAALTYVWAAFPLRPELGGSLSVDLASNVIFGGTAVLILFLAARHVRSRSDRPRDDSPDATMAHQEPLKPRH